jgi:hypothetical protein
VSASCVRQQVCTTNVCTTMPPIFGIDFPVLHSALCPFFFRCVEFFFFQRGDYDVFCDFFLRHGGRRIKGVLSSAGFDVK